MKITLLPEQRKFVCQKDDSSKEFTFDEITESNEWVQFKQIRLVHNVLNENGFPLEDLLNRDAFVESLKRGDEEWVRSQSNFELNVAIHKLYGLLEGKSEQEVDLEISNLMAQARQLYSQIKEWNHERSTKINLLEDALALAESEAEVSKIKRKIEKLRSQEKPLRVPEELKKMVFAAKDKNKPEITFANVSPDAVKKAYGDNLKII